MVETQVRGKTHRPTSARRLLAGPLACLAVLLALALPAGRSLAQNVSIPDTLVHKTSPLSEAEKTQIRDYVSQWSPGLGSQDPAQITQSRSRLLGPLQLDGVGVPFRLEYGNQVSAIAEPLLRSDDELTVINALRLLGEIATDRSVAAVESLVTDAAANPSAATASVRYTAVYALKCTFEEVASESPAVAPERIRGLLAKVGDVIRHDEDPWVLDVGVRALLAAATIEKQNFEGLRGDAYGQLAQAVSSRTRAMDAGEPAGGAPEDRLAFMVRASVAMRDALTDRRSLPSTAARDAAAMGGDVLAFVQARVEAHVERPSEERRLLTQLVTASQAVVYFSARPIDPNSNPATPPPFGGDPNNQPSDDDFRRAIRPELGKLSAGPFNFDAARFIRP